MKAFKKLWIRLRKLSQMDNLLKRYSLELYLKIKKKKQGGLCKIILKDKLKKYF